MPRGSHVGERTALLPSPGEYLVGHAAPFPVGRHGSCEANTAT